MWRRGGQAAATEDCWARGRERRGSGERPAGRGGDEREEEADEGGLGIMKEAAVEAPDGLRLAPARVVQMSEPLARMQASARVPGPQSRAQPGP